MLGPFRNQRTTVLLPVLIVAGLTSFGVGAFATEIADDATHDKPIRPERSEDRNPFPYTQLQRLSPLASLGGDGLRVVLDAYMNPYSYALTLGDKEDKVAGTLIIYGVMKPSSPHYHKKHFTMPRADC